MYFEELLKQITGEADLGVFLIVYAIGYFLAALVKVDASPLGIQGGVSPGTIAGISSIGILGMKKVVEALFRYISPWLEERRLKRRIASLKVYFKENNISVDSVRIDSITKMLDKDLIDDSTFEGFVNHALEQYVSRAFKEIGGATKEMETSKELFYEWSEKYSNTLKDFPSDLKQLKQLAESSQNESDLRTFSLKLVAKHESIAKEMEAQRRKEALSSSRQRINTESF